MRILIADDHDLVRETLCAFLEREDGIETRQVADFHATIAEIEAEGPFDLVLLDLEMPGMGGLAGLSRVLEASAERPVALFSGTASKSVAEEALALGAAGFLPKSLPAKSVVNAIRFMASGERYAPVAFLTDHRPPPEPDAHPLASRLSPRERQVLEGLSRGLSNKEIARELDLQEPTIKLHVKTLCRKLDARNRTHAAMIAKEAGLF